MGEGPVARMGGGRKRGVHGVFVRKPEEKRPLGRHNNHINSVIMNL
jgi:hypothetical protein